MRAIPVAAMTSLGHDRLATLWDRHADQVYAYACRRLGREGAADVVADVFAVAVGHPDRIPDDALPWLYVVARNVIANRRRAAARQRAITERVALNARDGTDEPADVFAERTAIAAALDQLSDHDREALWLTSWEGLDARRAAVVAGCSVGAFAVRLHRARRRLTDALQADPALLPVAVQRRTKR